MRRLSLSRVLGAFALLLFAGALSSHYGDVVRKLIVLVPALMLATIVLAGHDPDDKTQPHLRERADRPPRMTHHPDFQVFLDAVLEPLLVVERQRVTNANRAALHVFGNQIVGSDIRTAIRHAGAIERILDSDADHRGQPIRLTGLGQREQQWDLRIHALGAGLKLVALADRTDAAASERMRVDFVANASHELLTPLASVKGFIETLSDDTVGGNAATRNRFLGIMAVETDRMQSLIRDLMSLSRIEAGKYQPVETPIDLVALVDETLAILRGGSNPRGADIRFELASQPPVVLGDPMQIGQMVSNIVANSMKYGRAGTPIRVTLGASRSGNMARLTVEDEGEGIAPEHIPRLTERFYRVDSGRSRSLGGTGLGLSLVKHIVERHRGHLEIASELQQGTRVTVLVPSAPDGRTPMQHDMQMT